MGSWELVTRYRALIISICLAALTAVVYRGVVGFDFIEYDDSKYVVENVHVQQGVSVESVRWAFTSQHASNWHPLTWLSLMVDRQVFGSDAGGFHFTNLLFHIANALLLFIFLGRCRLGIWPSAFVAAAFAVHPLHVESVAWVAERKDVLSSFFWMLTMLAYVCYVERPKIMRYLAVVVFFVLGLMAKPMLVTLPFVLLLLDYWPLRRFKSKPLFLILEKVPLLIFAAISSVITFIVQKNAMTTMGTCTFKLRVFNALNSYMVYIEKMFWPNNLAVFYPHPGNSLSSWQIITAVVILSVITVAVVWQRRRRGYLIVGWLWYLGTLIPTIGLVQVGKQACADRYTYIPLIGLFIMIAWLISDVSAKWRFQRKIVAGVGLVLLAVMSLCTWKQVGYWRDNTTLFTHALNVTSDNDVAHVHLGTTLGKQGEFARAIEHFQAVLKVQPDHRDANFNMGKALDELNMPQKAIEHYRKVLRLTPNDAEVYDGLGISLMKVGKFDEAIAAYGKGLEYGPDDVSLHSNLGIALIHQQRIDEAATHFKAALAEAPNSSVYGNLSVALVMLGKYEEAIRYCIEAIEFEPENAINHYNLANTLAAQGQMTKAIAAYKETLRIQPDFPKCRYRLSQALAIETAGKKRDP